MAVDLGNNILALIEPAIEPKKMLTDGKWQSFDGQI